MTEKSSSGQPIAEIEIGDEMPIALYRLYAEDGTLLYVGITNSLKARFTEHRKGKPWWPLVARKTVMWHEIRESALEAEATAILGEHPVYNIAGTASGHGVSDKFGRPPATRATRPCAEHAKMSASRIEYRPDAWTSAPATVSDEVALRAATEAECEQLGLRKYPVHPFVFAITRTTHDRDGRVLQVRHEISDPGRVELVYSGIPLS